MTMPGRKYSQPSSSYRYGFNGKENDKDAGEGIQDYGMRIYDCRLGKFLSVDPLSAKYAYYTPYQFAGNSPILFIDLDGAEPCYPLTLQAWRDLAYYFSAPYDQFTSKRYYSSLNKPNQYDMNDISMLKAYFAMNWSVRMTVCDGGPCRGTGEPPYPGSVTLKEKKKGWFDCITAMIGAVQILYNKFDTKSIPNSGGNVKTFIQNMYKKGLSKKAENVDFFANGKNITKSKNDQTPLALPDATNMGDVLKKSVNGKGGEHLFMISFFDGMHACIVNVSVDDKNNTTFKLYDETSLSNQTNTKDMNLTQFNAAIAAYGRQQLRKSSAPDPTTPDTRMNVTTTVSEIIKQ
jgi:RHS repeat-associated protein